MTDATKKVWVRATAPGFHVGRRRVGDEFEFEARLVDGKPKLGSWMEAVADEELAERAAEAAAEAAAKPKHVKAPKVADAQKTLAEGAKAAGHTSPNAANNGREKITLSKGAAQTGADLV